MADVEVIVTTYNNPLALHFALLALSRQSTSEFRVCIADDGSAQATLDVVKAWSERFGADRFRHVWHPDTGFAKNQILNKAIATSTANYLVFVDGDCLASPGFVLRHLELRRPRQFISGSLIRMPLSVNPVLCDNLIINGEIFTKTGYRPMVVLIAWVRG